MNYSEAAYFNRDACQHIADWCEHKRLVRATATLTALRRHDRIRMPM